MHRSTVWKCLWLAMLASSAVLSGCGKGKSAPPPATASFSFTRADSGAVGTAGTSLSTSLNPGDFETIQATALDSSGNAIASTLQPTVTFSVDNPNVLSLHPGGSNTTVVC